MTRNSLAFPARFRKDNHAIVDSKAKLSEQAMNAVSRFMSCEY